jgi:hypothetical protein
MKKLIAALALCVGTAAFANNTDEKVQKEQAQPTRTKEGPSQFVQKPGDSIKEAQRDAEKGVDATEVGPAVGKAAKDVTGMQTESEGTFKTAQAFSLTGTIKDKTMEGVTIERKGLPAADLDIRDKTAVWLDGKKVNKDALVEGAQVRAKFQLEGQDIVAVELKATSPKGTDKSMKEDEGTGGSGLENDAREMGTDVKEGAQDFGNDVKEGADETREDINKSLK